MRLLHRDRHHEDEGLTEIDRRRPAPVTRDHRDEPDRDRDGDARLAGERTQPTVRERTWTFAPGQLVSFVVGAALVVIGLIALVRAGVDGSLGSPAVDVLSYRHTAWLGLAEIGLGVLLLLAGSGAWGRPLSVLLGAAMVVAGVLVLAETDQLPDELGLERDYGWPLLVLGALVAVAAMALPVWRRRDLRDDDVVDLRERLGERRDDEERYEDAKHPHF